MLDSVSGPNLSLGKGQIVDLPEADARQFIDCGFAVALPPAEVAACPTAVEVATESAADETSEAAEAIDTATEPTAEETADEAASKRRRKK